MIGQADGGTTPGDRSWTPGELWSAAFGGVFFGPGMEAVDVLVAGEAWSWAEAALRGAFFGVCTALAAMAYLRFSARGRERATVERAVSAGALPWDAGAEWVGRLTAERRRPRSDLVGAPLFSVGVAVLVAAAALQPEGPDGWGRLYAVGLVLTGGLLAVRGRRRLQTAERLLAQLGEVSGRGSGSAHVGDRSPSA
ncbi:hypothetical protein [Geodermatophilus obscurus]|uniref:hypothetical protein n=1 Tax=Geodermatophilus obscurus TaxID=1861 RepID=UPI0015880A74|nr:hypothetical protein [Geodermatophilus obscurus]